MKLIVASGKFVIMRIFIASIISKSKSLVKLYWSFFTNPNNLIGETLYAKFLLLLFGFLNEFEEISIRDIYFDHILNIFIKIDILLIK
jgi:hypothetical protein